MRGMQLGFGPRQQTLFRAYRGVRKVVKLQMVALQTYTAIILTVVGLLVRQVRHPLHWNFQNFYRVWP